MNRRKQNCEGGEKGLVVLYRTEGGVQSGIWTCDKHDLVRVSMDNNWNGWVHCDCVQKVGWTKKSLLAKKPPWTESETTTSKSSVRLIVPHLLALYSFQSQPQLCQAEMYVREGQRVHVR